MIKNQIMLWGAVASVLALFLSFDYWIEDDGTRPHNGIEENRESNIPQSPTEKTNQKPPKDLTLEDFESDLLLIKKMRSSTNRDEGLKHLVEKALQAEKHEFTAKAIEFALAMRSLSNRDRALRMIVDEALSQGHKDIAIRASDEIRSSSNADAARRKILQY